ncbi:hypothetical protein EV363DRAFT_1329929 [Boletus edulis]|nr:hypothetical protein EV363DRAFT_1329929 [Boletus edulis]
MTVCRPTYQGSLSCRHFLYIKLFPQDSARIKSIVSRLEWTLDTTHSLLVYTSIWIYLITNYGDVTKIDTIPILLISFRSFFSHRIHKLSRRQWRITALVLAFFRLCCATGKGIESYLAKRLSNSLKPNLQIHRKTFTAFKAEFRWVFTLGLAMSCLVDILVTGFLTHSLQTLQNDKRASTSLDRVIGAVVLYTFETNLLTSAATIVSMICWLTMPDNLVFMGLHFFISKLYANSLLATLNTRKHLQHQRQRGASADFPAGFPRFSSTPRRTTGKFSVSRSASLPCALILPFI